MAIEFKDDVFGGKYVTSEKIYYVK